MAKSTSDPFSPSSFVDYSTPHYLDVVPQAVRNSPRQLYHGCDISSILSPIQSRLHVNNFIGWCHLNSNTVTYQFFLNMREDSINYSWIFLDKARTMWHNLHSCFAYWGWCLTLSLDHISKIFDFRIFRWIEFLQPFPSTGCKINWVGYSLKTPFVSFILLWISLSFKHFSLNMSLGYDIIYPDILFSSWNCLTYVFLFQHLNFFSVLISYI